MQEHSKDYSGEPPSNWTSHSHGIQLYEQAQNAGRYPADLSAVGKTAFTGRARPSKDARHGKTQSPRPSHNYNTVPFPAKENR